MTDSTIIRLKILDKEERNREPVTFSKFIVSIQRSPIDTSFILLQIFAQRSFRLKRKNLNSAAW